MNHNNYNKSNKLYSKYVEIYQHNNINQIRYTCITRKTVWSPSWCLGKTIFKTIYYLSKV